jgi:hypothetical protein
MRLQIQPPIVTRDNVKNTAADDALAFLLPI